jgi:AcrR family transcriptional regulator
LEAAAAVFARKGYHQATIREIAELADVADGTIYNYYTDKQDLLVGIAQHVIAHSTSSVLAEYQDQDAEEYLKSILADRLGFARSQFDFTRALLSQVWTDGKFRSQYFEQVIAPLFGHIESYLLSRIAAGTIRPVNSPVVVRALAGAFLMFVMLSETPEDGLFPGLSDEELAGELADFFMHGLQNRQGEVPGG